MIFFSTLLALSIGGISGETSKAGNAIELADFIKAVVAQGRYGELPGPIGAAVNIPDRAPYRAVRVEAEKTTDKMGHVFKVLIEQTADSDDVKPAGLELDCAQTSAEKVDHYIFHASLNGTLKNASLISGKRDEKGATIKGSGEFVTQDINSPEIMKRFKHELDLWLKRTYLKKEWRTAEISEGELKK